MRRPLEALVRPSHSCADTEAPVAGPYPADACRLPSAACGVGAGWANKLDHHIRGHSSAISRKTALHNT